MHGRDDIGMSVAEAGYGGAAGGIDVGAPRGIHELDALAADNGSEWLADLAVQDPGHGVFFSPRGGQ